MSEVKSEKTSQPRKKRIRKFVESKTPGRFSIDQYRSKIRSLYDGPAGAMLSLGSLLSLHEPLVGRLIRKGRFDVTRFSSILDVGSGAGQILGHLVKVANPDSRLVAFDLSQGMLKRARQRLKSDRPEYVAGDLMNLPFSSESFDCVTCGWVLEHLPDPVPGLKEMERVLKPGGSVLLLVSEATLLGAVVSHTWKCRTYTREELHTACEQSGLPWKEQLWFTRLHRALKMGGILVEACKPTVNGNGAAYHISSSGTEKR